MPTARDWRRWTTFGVSRSAALIVDGLQSYPADRVPGGGPRDAEAMFDVLTYEKGAAVLRMLEQYLGEPVFRAGVRVYLEGARLRQHRDATTCGSALATATKACPSSEMMDGWVFTPGYPLVTASRRQRELILSQQRFS